MHLVIPENVHLVQTDALSHTAGIALLHEMSGNIAHALPQKKTQNSEPFYDNAISQSRKIAQKNA